MVQRVSEQSRSAPTASHTPDVGRPISPPVVSIHLDERNPLDGKPIHQEIVISDENHQYLLVSLASDGALALSKISGRDITPLYLTADMAQALVFSCYEWICDLERWQEEQEVKQIEKLKAAAGPMQDQEESIEEYYRNGFLTEQEYTALVQAEQLADLPRALANVSVSEGKKLEQIENAHNAELPGVCGLPSVFND